MNWDEYFVDIMNVASKKSKDKSTKVGCVIIGPSNEIRSTGYNNFPRGCNDDLEHRHERPEKYFWFEHAERNAIYNAAKVGIPLDNCKIYITMFPCIDCARAIVQVGIKEVITHVPNDEKWAESFKRSLELFDEVGVTVRYLCKND